jgi:two-component system OmpR family sensor kinase
MRWWWLPIPALVGAAVAIAVHAGGDRHVLFVETPLAVALLVVGLTGSATLLVMALTIGYGRRTAARVADGARQDRRRFLLRLDHELRNPITAIGMALANSESAGDGDDRLRALSSAHTQLDRLGRLLSDLRKLAELETERIERVPVDIAPVLGDVVDALRELPQAPERTISVHLPRAPWPPPRVPGDPDLLFLALFNLAANAVKYSRPGDTIELRAFDDDHALVIEVADTGQGIPADELDQVWQELARGRAARVEPGTGLGLPLVRAIVARHSGTVTLRSRDGLGTVVTIRLPVR